MKRKIKVTRKQYERIVLIYRISGFITIVGLLIGFAYLMGKPIEFVIMFLSYFFTKGLYKRQYHANSLKQCLLFSIGIFSIAIIFILPQSISICFSLIFGLTISFISYKVGNLLHIAKEYENLSMPKPFNTETCTESELIERCKELRLSEENTKLAIEFFIRKTKQSILAERLCIDEHSIAERKRRLKHKLNN